MDTWEHVFGYALLKFHGWVYNPDLRTMTAPNGKIVKQIELFRLCNRKYAEEVLLAGGTPMNMDLKKWSLSNRQTP